MNLPFHLTLMDQKPGVDWTDAEYAQMTEWWSQQERLVWAVAARHLGQGVTAEDVEEVWLDFYKTILSRARLSYLPGGPSFCVYALNVCFKNYCVQQGQRIRRRQAQDVAVSLETQMDRVTTGDPQKTVEQAAFFLALKNAVVSTKLSEPQKEAFLLRYYCAMSYDEIACEMQAPIGSVKAWVHRATVRLAAALRTQGWLE
jgi:RNA polymerase sigma-70 factor (ECF subfamily)